ncbi:MAG: AAA family ATPase [Thaumarchaeota archaeon]|nr:AAA family ATPase [Nitrososphaerota archaeon]
MNRMRGEIRKRAKITAEETWVVKHGPKTVSQMVGNEASRFGFVRWLEMWKRGGKPAILVGPSGVGKTSLVYALASEMGYTILELNASDARTKARIEAKVGPTRENRSLFNERLLILMDEIDGLYGRQDQGGIEAVKDLIMSAEVPVVMTANAERDDRIKRLGSKAEIFLFRRVPPRLVEMFLKQILGKEGIEIDSSILREVVESSNGDMRGAINDLMGVSLSKLIDLSSSGRDRSFDLEEGIGAILESDNLEEALKYSRSTRASPQEKLQGVFTSLIAADLGVEELAGALSAVSKADLILGRIRKNQDWRLLRYFDTILTSGVLKALQGKRRNVEFKKGTLPWDLRLRIWNEGRSFRILNAKLGNIFSVSSKDFGILYLPYMAAIANNDKAILESLSRIGIDDAAVRVFQKEMARIDTNLKKNGR